METFSVFVYLPLVTVFLSYLWGMETWKSGYACDWQGIYVLILPMRNGNNDGAKPYVREYTVLILPMRNGNGQVYSAGTKITLSSYPTYEEWKLVLFAPLLPVLLVLILPMRNGNFQKFQYIYRHRHSSYPTYEEWKLFFMFFFFWFLFRVLILPMRNGNVLFMCGFTVTVVRSYPTYEEWKLLIQL